MSRGTDFTTYKETLLTKMVENADLVQAVANNEPNFLVDTIDIEPTSLLYTKIFPYQKNPDIMTGDPQSLITMRFDRFKPINSIFKEGDIYFYIICHNSLLRTNSGLRYDFIFDQLDTLFNQSRDIGIGRLELLVVGDLNISNDYTGSYCGYHVVDFM